MGIRVIIFNVPAKSLIEYASQNAIETSSSQTMKFHLTGYTDRNGWESEPQNAQCIEVTSFPTDKHPNGKGKYMVGDVGVITFTFQDPVQEGDPFRAKQEDNQNFQLSPLVKNDHPVGFILTFPESLPLFEAVFAADEEESPRTSAGSAETERRKMMSGLGMLKRRLRKSKIPMNDFAKWQHRFKMKMKFAHEVRDAGEVMPSSQ